MKFDIIPVSVGRLHDVEKSRMTYLTNTGEKISIPLIMWVLKNDNDVIVFDSGADPTPVVRKNLGAEVDQPLGQDFRSLLTNVGVDPHRVRKVVISHLHWDHCGNLEHFPNAEILVQRTELAYAACPATCFCRTYASPQLGHQQTWQRVAQQIVPVDGSFKLVDGVDIMHLPGHTPGLQGLAISTAEGIYVLGSDTFNLVENYEKAVPPGIHVNIDDWYRSYNQVRRVADRVLPSHDLSVFDRERYGSS